MHQIHVHVHVVHNENNVDLFSCIIIGVEPLSCRLNGGFSCMCICKYQYDLL